MKWKNNIIHVTGIQKQVVPVTFTYEGDANNILNIDVTCGCMNHVYNPPFLNIDLSLPLKHPAIESFPFWVDKNIYITYVDNTTETLTIKCEVNE